MEQDRQRRGRTEAIGAIAARVLERLAFKIGDEWRDAEHEAQDIELVGHGRQPLIDRRAALARGMGNEGRSCRKRVVVAYGLGGGGHGLGGSLQEEVALALGVVLAAHPTLPTGPLEGQMLGMVKQW